MADAIAAPMAHAVKKDSTMVLILGVLTVILGFFAMMAPMVAGMTVVVMIGIVLIIAGVARTIFAFKAKSWGKGILVFLLGLLTLFAGFYMVTRPGSGLVSLTLFLAAYFVVDGIFEIIEAFDLKPIDGWGWMLFSGIVSVILGIMIWKRWPVSSAVVIGVLIGIKLIFAGTAMAMMGWAGRRVSGTAEDAIETAKGV